MSLYDPEFDGFDDEPEEDMEATLRRMRKLLRKRKKNPGMGYYIEPDELDEVVEYCIRRENYQEALEFCDLLLEFTPYSIEGWQKKGYILLNLQLYDESIAIFERILSESPSNTEALLNLALAYEKAGEYEKSLKAVNILYTLEPTEDVLFQKGLILQSNKKFDEAIAVFKLLLDSSFYAKEANEEIGNIYLIKANYKLSLEYYQRAIELDPMDAGNWYAAGICYYYMERFYKAIDCLNNCIALDEKHPFAYQYLGNSYIGLGRFKQALRFYFKSKAYDGGNPAVSVNIGIIYGAIGDYESAIIYFKEVLKLDKKYLPAYIGLGICYKSLGKTQLAKRWLEKALEISPKSADVWNEKAKLHAELFEISQAIFSFEKSIKFSNFFPPFVYEYSQFLIKIGALRRAKNELEQLLEINPKFSEPYYMLAKIEARLNQYKNCFSNLKRAIELEPRKFADFQQEFPSLLNKNVFRRFEEGLNPGLFTV